MPTLAGPLAACAALLIAALFVAWALRDKWDLVVEHARDSVRHALAAVLLLGTLAATLWTFSGGILSLKGIAETLISAGGIAAALEAGVLYTGWYIGQLDQRIASARRADIRESLQAQQKDLYHWFFGGVGISAVANVIFRAVQLQAQLRTPDARLTVVVSLLLAAFISAAPAFLLVLLTIKLRPLPRDYAEIQRQSVQRGLTLFATHAQGALLRGIRRMARGTVLSEQELAQMATALSFMRPYVTGDQSQALDQAFGAHAPQLGPGASASENAGEWLASADIARLYGIPARTAQTWLAQAPNRRQRPHSRAWEAPAATIYAAHGVPASPTGNEAASGPTRMRRRQNAPTAADETPVSEAVPLIVEATPQFAAWEVPTCADDAPGSVVRSV